MTFLSLSFREWPYPTKRRKNECCAWGECGFLAHSIGNIVTIYSNEIGRFSPMYMWSPFEHDISCMGWYDGSCTPSIVQPLLAICTFKGSVAVFDVRNKDILAKASFKGDVPTSIIWSPFYRSRFYIGTKGGFLNCMQMDEKIQPDIALKPKINLGFSVDFIALDPQTGTTVAVASKDGRFSVISSILTAKSDDTYNIFSLSLKENDAITTLSFFPDHTNFLILSTKYTSYLFSIHDQVTLPYIQTEGIRFISSPSKSTNRIIIGYDNAISLWQYDSNGWSRLSITTFATLKGMYPEAKIYLSLDDKVIVFTESHWLTVIEEHHDKLFIAQRIRLLPSKPLDWDFRKGSIAFATSSGSVLVTSWTPDAIIQPEVGYGGAVSMDDLASNLNNQKEDEFALLDGEAESPIAQSLPKSPDNQITFSDLMESNDLEVDIDQSDFEKAFDFSTSFVSIPASHMKKTGLVRRSSKQIREDVKKIWKQMQEDGSSPKNDLLLLPAEVSVDESSPSHNNQNTPFGHLSGSNNSSSPIAPVSTDEKVLCGNSNTLLLSFQVAQFPIDHVMWGPGGRLIVWAFHEGKNTLQLVDFKKRETKQLLSMQLNAIHVPISGIFFSEDRSLFCVIIGEQTALFISTSANPKQLGSLTFNSPVIGSFGPTGTDCVFISKDSLFYKVSVNDKDGVIITKRYRFPSKRGVPTFISWVAGGVIIGTELGKVHMYYGKDFADFKNIITITNPVYKIYQCSNNTFVIIDNQNNGVIHKTMEDIPIKGKVKNIKPASSETFLMKTEGSGKLFVLSINGKFSPLPPPCVSRCPLVQDPSRYQRELYNLSLKSPDEAIKACRLFGVIFIMRLIQAKQNPNSLSEHVSWLNGLISGCVQFSSWAIRLALKVGDTVTARNILLMTSPNSPDYITNMTKAALFDTLQPGEAVETATKALFDNNKYDEAIDLLLITGAVDVAANKLIDQGNIREAAMLLRMRRDKKKILDLYHKVATMLINQRKLMLGLLMLSEGGFNAEMVGLISSIVGVEFSHLLSFLDENDIHY